MNSPGINEISLSQENITEPIYILLIALVILIIFLSYITFRSHKRIVTTGEEGLIGRNATVIEELNPEGKVFIDGEIWDAVSDERLKKDTPVKIVSVEGMKLIVIKIN